MPCLTPHIPRCRPSNCKPAFTPFLVLGTNITSVTSHERETILFAVPKAKKGAKRVCIPHIGHRQPALICRADTTNSLVTMLSYTAMKSLDDVS